MCLIKARAAEILAQRSIAQQQGKNFESKFNYGMFYCFFFAAPHECSADSQCFISKQPDSLNKYFSFQTKICSFHNKLRNFRTGFAKCPASLASKWNIQQFIPFLLSRPAPLDQLSFCLVAYFFNKWFNILIKIHNEPSLGIWKSI